MRIAVTLLILFGGAIANANGVVQPRNVEFETDQNVPAVLDDVDDTMDSPEDSATERNGEFVIAPLPSHSPLLGWSVKVPAMYLYRPDGHSASSPPWITGAMGLYTEDGGWGAGLFHRMNFQEDLWRVFGAMFYADLDYSYYGIGGNPDTSIPINQTMQLLVLQALRRISPNTYVGLRVTGSQSEIRLNIDSDLLPPGPGLPELAVETSTATLAPRVQYDSRDNEFYPTMGVFAEAAVSLGREWLGGDSNYEKTTIQFNDYRSMSKAGVLASRLAVQYLGGDAPFFVYPAFGSGADLRGYESGAYRDRFLVAVQTEYRHRLTNRFGVVAFAGVGSTAPAFAEWTETLWSVGTGVRWVVAQRNNMSLRFDVARGREDTQFYIGLGEAC